MNLLPDRDDYDVIDITQFHYLVALVAAVYITKKFLLYTQLLCI